MRQRKITWADLISLIAAIIFGIISYLGALYLNYNKGDVIGMSNNIGCIGIAILSSASFLLLSSIAKILKLTRTHFSIAIKLEILFLLLYFSAAVGMLKISTFFHYFTVLDQKEIILQDVRNSIKATEMMFTNYDIYTKRRLSLYENDLRTYCNTHPNEISQWQIDRFIFSMKAHLIPSNYDDPVSNNGIKQVAQKMLNNHYNNTLTWPSFSILDIISELHYKPAEFFQLMTAYSKETEPYEGSLSRVPFKFQNTAFIPTQKINSESEKTFLGYASYFLLLGLILLNYITCERDGRVQNLSKLIFNK